MQNSKKGFNYSLLALLLFVLAFIVQFISVHLNSDFLTIVVGLAFLISFLLAIVAGVYLIKGLKEEGSSEQMIGLSICSIFLMIIVYNIVILCSMI